MMYLGIFLLVIGLKFIFLHGYRSTDFEVHRNWLSITHSLPMREWYYENTNQWTLDYPPFFAYFEYILSHAAKYFDPEMLEVTNLDYQSKSTVLFQRLSVIASDVVFFIGTKSCISALNFRTKAQRTVLAGLLLANVGLIFVDHIHFQYNGFLFGFLLLSIARMLTEKYLQSALFFCVLLNLKHIFIYLAPAYVVFLLKFYCLSGQEKPLIRLIKLGAIVLSTLVASFGPFYNHVPQILSRLFPFKRGLTHAYWAPNFWALYNFADKVSTIALNKGQKIGSFTGGLVQEFDHEILPSIKPWVTFALTAIFMLPCVAKLFSLKDKRIFGDNFIRAIVICCATSFMFGWHVHEKAILMIIIPLSLLAPKYEADAKFNFFLSVIGHYSLFPLIFTTELFLVKIFLHLAFTFASLLGLKSIFKNIYLPSYEIFYLFGIFGLIFYETILQYVLNLSEKLPFLPLMLISVYCSLGLIYFYIKYYFYFLSINLDYNKPKTK